MYTMVIAYNAYYYKRIWYLFLNCIINAYLACNDCIEYCYCREIIFLSTLFI